MGPDRRRGSARVGISMVNRRSKRTRVCSGAALIVVLTLGLLGWVRLRPSYPTVNYAQKFFEHSRLHADTPPQGGDGYLRVQALIKHVQEREAAIDRAVKNEWRSLGFDDDPLADFSWHCLQGSMHDVDEIDRRLTTLAHEELDRLEAEGFFDELAVALAMSDHSPPLRGEPLWAAIRERTLVRLTDILPLAAARLRRALDSGDISRARLVTREMIGLARLCGTETTSLNLLMQVAALGQLIHAVQSWTMNAEPSADAARAVLESLRNANGQIDVKRTLEGEWLIALSFVQWLHHEPLDDLSAMALLWRVADTQARRNARIDRAYHQLVQLAQRDLVGDALDRIDEIDATLQADSAIDFMMTPSRRYIVSCRVLETMLGGVQLLLALEVHRIENGGYPDSLESLAPAILDEVPRDSFAPDGRFVYRRLNDSSSESTRSYLLYSVGTDGVDDGGAVHEHHHQAFSIEPERGIDFVINREWD